ncbi:MAG: guanylate kinase [Thermodesulfobacteriota bacterium]
MGKGLLFIISAPSGVGKTTLCRKAADSIQGMKHSVSYTTRKPRNAEEDGIDYNFVTPEVFEKMIERREFIEWAVVHGNRYGTSRKDIREMLKHGLDVILDIDVQGAKQIKDNLDEKDKGEWIFIFLLPPTMSVCKKRLKERGLDSDEIIEKRLNNAKKEIKEASWYDYIIENDTIRDALERFKAIIMAEKSKTVRSHSMIEKLLTN